MCRVPTHVLQHTAIHSNTLQHAATCCNKNQTLQMCRVPTHVLQHCNTQQHTATPCNTLQQELNPPNIQIAYKKSGAVGKLFDKSVKGYVLESEGGCDVKMQVPAGDKEVIWQIREWHGSFIRVTWLIYKCVIWHIHMSAVTSAYTV